MKKAINCLVVLLAILSIYGFTVCAEEEQNEFDYILYAEENPDLKAIYGYDKEQLYNHYVTVGKRENRVAHFEGGAGYFDYMAYLSMYPELRSIYGEDYEALYIHYVTTGRYEGRVAYFYPSGYVGSASNKKVERSGSTFTIEGLAVETTNAPYFTPYNKSIFSNPDGGFPVVYEYYDSEGCFVDIIFQINRAVGYGTNARYSQNEFISDCFRLYTDEEKLAYINYAIKNKKYLVYPAVAWIATTDYFTLDEKISIIKECGVGPMSEYYNNWLWDVYASKLPNGTKTNNIIEAHFKNIGNQLHSVIGSDNASYMIPEQDVERYRKNGIITKRIGTALLLGTLESQYECEVIDVSRIDCERWYMH